MGASQLAMPDRLSFPLKVTVTSVLFQPNALGGTSRAALAVGLVLSMLMLLTVDGSAALPATSTQLPVLVTVWLAPSVLTVAPATVLVAMPDCTAPASAQLKPTVTSTLFQPKVFGAGLRLPSITGLVLSIFTVTLATALTLPALSVHVPLTSVPAVSAVRLLPAMQLSMPLCTVPASPLLVKLTATSVLFQPAALAAGVRTAVGALGGVLSMLISFTVTGSAALPALSTQLPVLVTDWFVPSVLTVAPVTVLMSMPDCPVLLSAQVKLTVTSVLFQPK